MSSLSSTSNTLDSAFENHPRPGISTELMERLVVMSKKRRVHDFLRDFDKLGLKRLVPEQAFRALSVCGINLSKKDQEELRAAYVGTDGFFAYEFFEADITDTPLNGNLEKNPLVSKISNDPFAKFNLPGTFAALPAALMPKTKLDDDSDRKLHGILEHCKYIVKTRGIMLAQYVRQYDVTHRGVVTESRFIREFISCFKDVREEDAKLVAKAYGTADHQVRYMAVHRDITPDGVGLAIATNAVINVNNFQVDQLDSSGVHLEKGPRGVSPNKKMERNAHQFRTDSEVDVLLQAIIRYVWERRIRIKDIFIDFDKMHLNRITRPQFVRAVGQLRVEGMKLNTVDEMAGRYLVEGEASGNVVAYRRFLEDIENAFTLARLEKDPHAFNQTLAHTVVTRPPPSSLRNELSVEEMRLLDTVLAGLRTNIVRVKAYNLRAGMRDFDQLCEGFITIDRFLRALAIYNLVPERKEERDVLLARFKGRGKHANNINWRACMDDLGY